MYISFAVIYGKSFSRVTDSKPAVLLWKESATGIFNLGPCHVRSGMTSPNSLEIAQPPFLYKKRTLPYVFSRLCCPLSKRCSPILLILCSSSVLNTISIIWSMNKITYPKMNLETFKNQTADQT